MLKQREVQQYLTSNRIKWVFNVERAPWWGGVFERMIKSTKRCLRKVVGRAKLYYDELSTVLVEIEAVINSRPLTYLSAEDLDEPLTPSHFLCGRRILSLPDGLFEEDTDEEFTPTQPDLTRRLRHLNVVLNQFWRRWREEYLLELREAHRYHGGRPSAVPPSVGDVVLIEDEDQPRGMWKLARIQSLITGSDGRTRGAVVRVLSSGGPSTLQRPLQRLYPVEVTTGSVHHQRSTSSPEEGHTPETEVTTEPESEPVNVDVSRPVSARPRRAAAATARDRLAACAMLESDP